MDNHAFEGLALLHDLVPFLPIDRLHAILHDEPLPDVDHGATLFADISGFTTLMEALSRELGPERGAEELNQQINATFSGMIDAVSRYHGAVIRFSGDGLTAWYKGDNAALRAAGSALAVQAFGQAIMSHYPNLRLKVGIGLGETRRFCPGDPQLGIYDVLAGPAVDQMARAEQMAPPGQIVLSPEISAAIGRTFAQQPLFDGFTILSPTVFVPEDLVERWPALRWLDHAEQSWRLVEACRPFMPAPLYERVSSGHGAYMADLRLVTPLFIRFTGIDYRAPDAAARLDELVRQAQQVVQQFGGYLSEVGVGDKGSEMVALFGAPIALENPALRATYAANNLIMELPHVASLHFGMTCDQLFTGTVGSPMRRAYAAVGDEVNLAARLMARAGPGEVLADIRSAESANEFAWKALSPMRLKGKIAPVRVYQLAGSARVTRPLWPEGEFVARDKELSALQWSLDTKTASSARILLMIGQPGLGKSHLLHKFNDMLTEQGITGLLGAGRSIDRQTPYHPWQTIFRDYFGLNTRESAAAWQEAVLARLNQIDPALESHAPLLNDILQLGLQENSFSNSLEPAERHAMLCNLAIILLKAWLTEDTLAIVLDNAQWMDALSWDLAGCIASQLAAFPLTLLFAMRPFKDRKPVPFIQIEEMAHTRKLALEPLNAEDTALLAAETLGVKLVAPPLAQFILQKTGGNPFFIKEVVNVLRENDHIAVAHGEATLRGDPQTLRLPDTVQGIVRSRIDQLPPDQQTILKVAAVLGPQFRYSTLRAIQPLRLNEESLRKCLAALDSMDLSCVEETETDSTYAFSYAITRELAYHALSFSQRRQLHEAAARWYEHEYRGDLAPFYGLLAHHWRAAEKPEREQLYTYLAGMRAADQYANEDAITYLNRTLEITAKDQIDVRFDTLHRLDDLYHLVADRQNQLATLETLSDLIMPSGNSEWIARVQVQWTRYYESVAEYDAALDMARQASASAEMIGHSDLMAQSRIYQGTALMQLGRLEEARAILSDDRIISTRPSIEVWRLTVLAVTLSRMGLFDETAPVFHEAQSIATATNNRAAVGQILKSMGDNYVAMADYEAARQYYKRSLQIRVAIGDSKGEAETLSKLGVLSMLMGEYPQAQTYLERTHLLAQKTVDRASEAETLRSIGMLHFQRRDYEAAHEPLTRTLALRQAINDQRGAASAMIELAMCEIMLGELAQAKALLDEALASSAGLDRITQAHIRFECRPLCAQIAMRMGDNTTAAMMIQEMQAIIAEYGLATLPHPFRSSLIAHTVLSGIGKESEAKALLKAAYDLLNQRADRISEPEKRARYLLTVSNHREIVGLYERVGMT
ncbi:MAG: tetratricopeptide repeat protein [Anaerolineae bacterium]|nr:tetratricopeptide repeat protein [Anaerolineae bacterium]